MDAAAPTAPCTPHTAPAARPGHGRRWGLLGGAAAAAVAVLAAVAWWLTAPRPAYTPATFAAIDHPGDAARGRLVFTTADCSSCHAAPNQSDRLRLGGGLALPSPYGTLHVPNISPDPIDGIGRWRTVDLANALLSGVSPGGSHYYPELPYTSYARMRTDDVIDLMAYLRTLAPVKGRPPPHELAFPFNIRRLIGGWKLLYFNREPLPPEATRSAEWNRGRYLVDALAHCAECHSSRNALGAIKESTRFAGGRDPSGTGFVPNITATGLAHWREADLVRLLEDGRTPDLRTVGSSMADVVANTRELPAADRAAIAAYIKSLPAKETATP